MRKGKVTVLHKVNIPRVMCDHLVGKNHSVYHRYTTGVIVMSAGVGITKVVFFFEAGFIHIMGDIVGYAIHGLGAVPFIERFLSHVDHVEAKPSEPFKIKWEDKGENDEYCSCEGVVIAESPEKAIEILKGKYKTAKNFDVTS